ncbi:MAG: glycosyltransferase family 87 protein [Spirochaetia bacterium]
MKKDIQQYMKGKQRRVLVASIVLIGFVLSTVFHYVLGAYCTKGYPYSTFLFNPSDRFNDFNHVYEIVKGLTPYNSGYWLISIYFPFANAFFYLFSIVHYKYLSLCLFIGIFVVCYALMMRRAFYNSLGRDVLFFLVVGFVAYPFLFILDRANIEGYLFLCLLGFILLYRESRHEILSSFLLASAICMKLYPGVFLVLLLRDRKYRNILYTCAFCLILTIASLLLFKGGAIANIKWLLDNLHAFGPFYSGLNGLQHEASFYPIIKVASFLIQRMTGGSKLPFDQVGLALDNVLLRPYSIACVIVFIGLSFFIVLRKDLRFWKSVALLCFSMILLPPVSFDYKLISLLIPLFFFLCESERKQYLYAILFALLLIPKDYFWLRGDISIAVVLNPLLMVTIAGMILFRRQSSASLSIRE